MGYTDKPCVPSYGCVSASRGQDLETRSQTSECSQNSVFSDYSDVSSQSSLTYSEPELDNVPERSFPKPQPCPRDLPKLVTAVPPENRQHPRRSSSDNRIPPSLPRQDERKVLFVNDLVDSATAMVEAIWPLSGACAQTSNGRGVLPLRRYIEETLRRSRTSYSTLQVALYYLILIKPYVPKHDFTMEQSADSMALRSMQCGRRMFLAALILASKYLQDRNYSAKAWSKMSGLKTVEINSNERYFLAAVSWKLHISDEVFKRWTDVVLRFTAPSPPPGRGNIPIPSSKVVWKKMVPFLTPELDEPILKSDMGILYALSPVHAVPPQISLPARLNRTPPKIGSIMTIAPWSTSKETTPTPANFLSRSDEPPTPALARRTGQYLPTPQMTPASMASNTPAVSTCSSRRPSISFVSATSQPNTVRRISCERFPLSYERDASGYSSTAPSLVSSGSSPASLISEGPRSSRSSSISSLTGLSTSAPGQATSAELATCGQTGYPISWTEAVRKSSAYNPDKTYTSYTDMDECSSPQESAMALPFKNNGITTLPLSCRKRSRSQLPAKTDGRLEDHVRSLLLKGPVTRVEPDDVEAVCHTSLSSVRSSLRRDDLTPKGAQTMGALGRSSSARVPIICKDAGRKRRCWSGENGEARLGHVATESSDEEASHL